jgi:hypothetical protein
MQRILLIIAARLRLLRWHAGRITSLLVARLHRFFDWRFVASLAVLVLFVAVIRSGLAAGEERDRAFALYESEHRDAIADRAASAHERAALLKGQQDVQAKLDRLIAYMRSQGYSIPDYVLSSEDDDSSSSGGGNDNGSSSSPSQKGSGRQSLPKSAPIAPAPAKPKPGNGGAGSDRQDDGSGNGSSQGHGSQGRGDKPSKADKPTKPDKPKK